MVAGCDVESSAAVEVWDCDVDLACGSDDYVVSCYSDCSVADSDGDEACGWGWTYDCAYVVPSGRLLISECPRMMQRLNLR